MKTAKNIVSMPIPTKYGDFVLWVWKGGRGQEPLALTTPSLDPTKEIMLRIHSECLTGDLFGSFTCDCGPQKEEALKQIGKHGNGIFIYHRQEGRNMGLFKKIQAYNLMQNGVDTHEANIMLSGNPDAREYSDVVEILNILLETHKSKIILLSNNPYKRLILERDGYSISLRSLRVGETIYNSEYIQTKEYKFSHYSGRYKPYVGITIYRSDLKNKQVVELIRSYKLIGRGQKLFLGVALFSEKGDLRDSTFIEELNAFANSLGEIQGLSIVLHMTYDARRQFYRDLQIFLKELDFRYSLQFRLEENKDLIKIDLDLIDALRVDNFIFQIKTSQYNLLEEQKFVEYFRMSNHYLLLDDSFGSGIEEKIEVTHTKIHSVIKKGISHIAIAGGYSSSRLINLRNLEDYFKFPLSVDAESRLRTNNELDIGEVKRYLDFFFKF